MYQQIKLNPEKKSILDTMNILTINNRELEIYSCLG